MITVHVGDVEINGNNPLFTKEYTDEDDISANLYDDLINPYDPVHHSRFDKLTPKEVDLLHRRISYAYPNFRGFVVDLGSAITKLWIQIV